MKNSQYDDKIKNGEVLVCNYNWTQPDKNICGEDAAMYMIPGTFPYAMQIYPYANPLGYQAANALVISANCEYPERAMELIEFMTSDEGARLVRTGVPGEDWDVVDGEPELIGKRLENFTSNDKEYSGYTTDGVQGIGKYKWLSPLWETNQCADGEPVDLTLSKKYVLSSVTEIDKDFCNYYTDGKAQNRKDLTQVIAAHNIPYVAQTTFVQNFKDLHTKAEKAIYTEGAAFLNVMAPCPRGWRYNTPDILEICQPAVDTCFWPLFEVIDGDWIVNYVPKKKLPIEDFLRPQRRFKHLFKPGKEELIARIQAEVDRKWEELLAKAK